MWQRILLLFLMGSLVLSVGLCAQDSNIFPREEYYTTPMMERTFSGVHWLEVIEGIDYRESVREERTEDENFFTDGNENKKNRRIYDNANGENLSNGFWAQLLKVLIIAVGIGIIAVIISRFLGPAGLSQTQNRRVEASKLEVSLKNIEEKIHESDLDQLTQQALQENNFNLAIRLAYLTIIKQLSITKTIRWKRDKTNRDYILELADNTYANEFKQLTGIFERVWYGNTTLTQNDFLILQPKFEHLMKTIKQESITKASNNTA